MPRPIAEKSPLSRNDVPAAEPQHHREQEVVDDDEDDGGRQPGEREREVVADRTQAATAQAASALRT